MSEHLIQPDHQDFIFDPMSSDFDRDPYPILANLREHEPVYWWPQARGWFLTRHDDIVSVLADEDRFSPNEVHWEYFIEPAEEVRNHPVLRIRDSSILSVEGVQHARIRKLAFKALSRRAVRTIEPLMTSLIEEVMAPLRGRRECDFVTEIASPYPIGVISRLLGIPGNSDREMRFKKLADAVVVAFNPMIDEATQLRSIHLMEGYLAEIAEWMEEKRRKPTDDLMSHLVQVEHEGDRFNTDEILSLISALLVAGAETTANSLSFGMLELLRHPDQMKRFKEDPSCRANAAYEMVRYEMPGRFLRRYAKKDTEIRGKKIRAGQAVYISVASAQRDPSFMPDCDQFDITREPRDLSAFGIGRHFCIGAQLARLEIEIALGHFLGSFEDIRLACSFEDVPFRSNPVIRGPASIPLLFESVA